MRSEILIVTFVSISLTWARTPYSLSLAVGPTTTPSYPEDVENLTDNDEVSQFVRNVQLDRSMHFIQ